MLYYFSHLYATTPLLTESHTDGRPIVVVCAEVDSSTVPLVPFPSVPRTTRSSIPNLGPPRRSARFQTNDKDVVPDIDAIRKEAPLGCKGYMGVLAIRKNYL